MKTTEIGNAGEAAVCRWLKLRGYKILDRNYRTRFGEIDIIARNKDYIAFIEVKTRKAGSLVSGVYAVDYHKQQRIIMATKDYLLKNQTDLQPRFDVADVVPIKSFWKKYQINYIENAFGV